MKSSVCIRALMTAACLGLCECAATSSPRSPSDDGASFVGTWMGVRHIQELHFEAEEGVYLEIERKPAGLFVVDRGREAIGQPPAVALVHGRSITADLPAMMGGMTFAGELSADGHTLTIQLGREGRQASATEHVVLTHASAEARRYFEPGRVGGAFVYQPPEPQRDGWQVGSLRGSDVNLSLLARMDQAIRAQTADPKGNETDSVLIAKEGALVFEQYYWGYGPRTPHPISSDTKSVTSIVAGVASDRGALRSAGMIYDLFPDYASAPWIREHYPVTVGQMLSMTANLDWNEDLPYQDPGNTAVGLSIASDPIAYVLNRKLAGPPGARFQYNSGLPNVIGDAVSRSVKQPFGDFARQVLFDPLGIQNWYWTTQKNGHVLAAGGLYLLPRDMAKIGQMMLDDGVWDGRRVVSASWVHESTAQKTPEGDYAYGYFWHLSTPSKPRLEGENGFMAIGQGGQYIVVIPRLKAVVVVTSSNWQPGGTKLGLTEIIDRFVVPALHGKDRPDSHTVP